MLKHLSSNASIWSTTSDLLFNELKFIHLRFFSKTPSSNQTIYSVNENPIRSTQQHKDLGITFSSDLTWTAHYNIIISKAYKMLGLIRRTFKIDLCHCQETIVYRTSQISISVLLDLMETASNKGHNNNRTHST